MNMQWLVPGVKLKLSFLICCCILLSSPSTFAQSEDIEVDFSLLFDSAVDVKTGDIIFRRGTGAGSRFVNLVDDQSTFSHVGLIQKDDETLFVIHAMPESVQGDGWVRKEPLADFLAEATAIGVYRVLPEHAHITETAVNKALTWIDSIPFDSHFDIATADELYCTELVWLAYQLAGLDLVNNQFEELELPFGFTGDYLLPSRLMNSPYFQHVISIPS